MKVFDTELNGKNYDICMEHAIDDITFQPIVRFYTIVKNSKVNFKLTFPMWKTGALGVKSNEAMQREILDSLKPELEELVK